MKKLKGEQGVFPGLPQPRGGYRLGAGAKPSQPETVVIRVARAVVPQCKVIDAEYRAKYKPER